MRADVSLVDQSLGRPYLVHIGWVGFLSYAFTQSKLPLVYDFSFMNNSSEAINNLHLSITFDFDFLDPVNMNFTEIPSGKFVEIKPSFRIYAKRLFELTESCQDHMTIKFEADDEVLFEETLNLPIFAMNQWSGAGLFPESIASFSLPNVPAVTSLQSRAAQMLKRISGQTAFTSYYDDDKNVVRQQMAAIYATIYEQNINYAVSPANIEEQGQRVRLPHDVLASKTGNCIEMSLLFCSLCEAFKLNSFIVCIHGHAFAGVWLKDDGFDKNSTYDVAELKKRLADGINDIEVVECTSMNANSNKGFELAVRQARGSLDDESQFIVAIDIHRSHLSGIRPMPIRVVEQGEVKIVDYGLAEDAEIRGVVSKTLEEHFIDTSKQEDISKSTIWMRNLLDLSKRNNLISSRVGSNNIQLFASNLPSLEDALAKGEAFTLKEKSEDWQAAAKNISFADVESHSEIIDRISETDFKSHQLRTFLTEAQLSTTLKKLYREALLSIEETGSNTLYLALGFLRWVDPKDPTDADGARPFRHAPLVLLPVDLIRSSKGTYQLSLRDEDAQMNITLLEMLRQQFDLKIGGLSPLPLDEFGVDLALVFNSIRLAIMNQKGWDVVEMATLGLFLFSQFVMWNDLRERFDVLTKNKVVRALVDGLYVSESDASISSKDLDDQTKVADVVVPSSVDSSQLAAIVEAARGSSFVLHGPPGTGKSQTITNMIANAVYQGKSVIFVAEKMAALDVVNERLKAIGLGDYCLELHSNKTQKRHVLEKLENNLTLGALNEPEAFKQKAVQIQTVRNKLNESVFALHRVQPYGKSIYDLIGLRDAQSVNEKVFAFTPEELEDLSLARYYEWDSIVRSLDLVMNKLTSTYYEHPLKEWRKSGYSINSGNRVRSLLEEILQNSQQLREEITAFAKSSDIKDKIINQAIVLKALVSLQSVQQERNIKTKVDYALFNRLLDEDNIASMRQVMEMDAAYHEANDGLKERYTNGIDSFDYVTAKRDFLQASSSKFFKAKSIGKALQDINGLTKGFVVTADNALSEFDAIAQASEYKQALSDSITRCVALLEISLSDHVDKVDALEDLFCLSHTIRELLPALKDDRSALFELYKVAATEDFQAAVALNRAKANYEQLVSQLGALEPLVGLNGDEMIERASWLDRLEADTKIWFEYLPEWRDWSAFYAELENLDTHGLGAIRRGLFKHDVDIKANDDLLKYYYYSLAEDLIHYHVDDEPSLSRFNGLTFENQIKEYNRLLNEFEAICQEQIRVGLSRNLPHVNKPTLEEARQLANLNRIIRSKGRGTSIRKLFQESNLVIKRLTPCLLMSPLSVAQYIDPSFPRFDLVIFDEASQIRTSVAIGAMSRAKDCIIVGDPNQMPPTSFFSSQIEDEENYQIEELESLLEDCLAINMPSRYLDYHYRSQSESLIAFSNQMYYESRMRTFPSPFDLTSKVTMKRINGIYDRSLSRTNKIEAEAIVDDIIKRLKNPDQANDSIGVVTFSLTQQNLIDDLFQARLQRDRELRTIVDNLQEPIFIKNLENVQGDERDVILFSTGYGPDADGKISSNFGPLNRKGGWRRLNVAVSRARKEMTIFSSLDPQDVKIRSTSSEGLIGIRQFMEFAAGGHMIKRASSDVSTKKEKDDLLESIAEFLREYGYAVDTHVGTSGFRLDVAVTDPHNKDRYLCAIRLDGKQYANADTTRDRNRLMPAILKVRGWIVYSLWTLDWYDNKQRESEKLLAFLADLSEKSKVQQPETPKVEEPAEIIEFVPEMKQEKVVFIPDSFDVALDEEQLVIEEVLKLTPIRVANVFDAPPTQDVNDDPKTPIERIYVKYVQEETYASDDLEADPVRITNLMKQIIETEFPIREDLINNRIATFFDGARLSAKRQGYLANCLKKVKSKKTKQGEFTYYWPHGYEPQTYIEFRIPTDDDKREMDKVSDQELANIIWHVALQNLAEDGQTVLIGEDEILKQVSLMLGFSRMTEKMLTSGRSAVSQAVRRKILIRKGKQFVLGEMATRG